MEIHGDWLALQLAEFLAVVTSVHDESSANRHGVERAAEALEAEVCALLRDGRVLASVGFPRGRVPALDLWAVAEGERKNLMLPDVGQCQTLVVVWEDDPSTRLLLARSGGEGFQPEEVQLARAMCRVLGLTVTLHRALDRLAQESTAAVEESEALRSAILESALDCIIAIDAAGNLVEFNPAAERTFGYRRADVIGKEMAELIIPPSLRDQHRRGVARFLETGEAPVLGRRIELVGMRSDESEFPIELTVTRVDVPGPPLFTGYIRDITERVRAREEIERALETEREAAERLRELDELKDLFLQAVSHDLRTPLTVIIGIALTLERASEELSATEQGDLRARLASNARKLDRILVNLLDLNRLASGRTEARRELTSLPDLVGRVLEGADYLDGRRVTLIVEPMAAEIDGAKVERILENLLVNAAKHTPSDVAIWVRVCPWDRGILIAVEDAGPGVPQEMRNVIFQPFERGNQNHPAPGSGVGLALVARFAELHGGRAWIEERDGGGASFRVLLPA